MEHEGDQEPSPCCCLILSDICWIFFPSCLPFTTYPLIFFQLAICVSPDDLPCYHHQAYLFRIYYYPSVSLLVHVRVLRMMMKLEMLITIMTEWKILSLIIRY